MGETKPFYCLRCQHRFAAEHIPRVATERACPACGSNSVRLETPAAAARHQGEGSTPQAKE